MASVDSGVSRAAASVLGLATWLSRERSHGAIGRRLPEPTFSRQFARFLRQAGIEVVLAEYGPTAATILDACSIARIPMVVHFHGYDAYRRQTVTELRDATTQQVIQKTAVAGTVDAPLAGNIYKILVTQGQSVASGDVVMILEAMKMETEVRATSAGTVDKILVKEGDAVQVGTQLLSLS